jgi:hypothetical protein
MTPWIEYDRWEARMDQATRDAVREGCKESAAVVLPVVFGTLGTPSSLIDVGAGEGWWCEAARDLGVPLVGGVDVEGIELDGFAIVLPWDAEKFEPLPTLMGTSGEELFDVALCLEVAEHVTPAAGEWLVAELCRVAQVVVWSAAIPGQGGDGHINEQWPDYWQQRFQSNGFLLTDPWRRRLWTHPSVEPWYRQNLLLARNLRTSNAFYASPPDPLVHPVTWAHHRGVPGPGA